MTFHASDLKVMLASDGFRLQAFRWRGRVVRVVAVEDVRALGFERRYRVWTPEGAYELGLDIAAGVWTLRRAPSWLARVRARLANMPRYPLPAWRRRVRPAGAIGSREAPAGPAVRGGAHASRLALVRQ